MNTKIGIWLDYDKAYFVTINGNEITTKKIESEIEHLLRIEGEQSNHTRFGEHRSNNEYSKNERKKNQTKEYVKNLVHHLNGASAIMIFGPAEAKKELEKAINEKKDMAGKVKAVLSADVMSENQIVAKVKEFFAV